MTVSADQALGFIKDFGLPITIFLVILWSGYKRKWYYGGVVDDMTAQYEKRLAEKNDEIKFLRAANEVNSKTAEESLATAKTIKGILDRIERPISRHRGD